MKRISAVLLLSALVGYAAAYVNSEQTNSVQARGQGQALNQGSALYTDTVPPAIPPVPNPPLYPDPPHKAVYIDVDDARKIYATRQAFRAANPDALYGTEPRPAGMNYSEIYRTHWYDASYFRAHYTSPRPSNVTGRTSIYDDADQHQGVSDFYVFTGGSGKMIVDGVIENREFTRFPATWIVGKDPYNPGTDQVIVPNDYGGLPVIGGRTYDVQAGDWMMVPPNDEHWWQPSVDGLGYLLLKVNIGTYPSSLIH